MVNPRLVNVVNLEIGLQAKGNHGTYLVLKQLHRNIWHAIDERTKQNVCLKAAPDYLFRKEREILNRFQNLRSLRRIIDDVQDPPLLVLEYLDTNLLAESGTKKIESSDVKRVAKTILQALAALHEEGIVHTDVKPDNILVNYGENGSRFGDIKLADCGDSTHVDSVVQEHFIGATIFRSPEAMLNLSWGTPTDIWSLGATLISLIWGKHFHIFKPPKTDVTDRAYPYEVMRRQVLYFGPFPMSYRTLADPETLDKLAAIMNSVEERKPFELASSKEILKEDREFVCRLMRLDPRDRPSAKVLLQDAWFKGCVADPE